MNLAAGSMDTTLKTMVFTAKVDFSIASWVLSVRYRV